MVTALGAKPDAGTVIEPQTATFGLLVRDFKPLLTPDAYHPGVAHLPALPEQQSMYPAITVTTILRCQSRDGSSQADTSSLGWGT